MLTNQKKYQNETAVG